MAEITARAAEARGVCTRAMYNARTSPTPMLHDASRTAAHAHVKVDDTVDRTWLDG